MFSTFLLIAVTQKVASSEAAAETDLLKGLPAFASEMPSEDLKVLNEMRDDVRQAYRDLQAADAATVAVAQFLTEKKNHAAAAREKAHSAALLLLEEMRQLEKQYQLRKALSESKQLEA